jgi:hypothetical protein
MLDPKRFRASNSQRRKRDGFLRAINRTLGAINRILR